MSKGGCSEENVGRSVWNFTNKVFSPSNKLNLILAEINS